MPNIPHARHKARSSSWRHLAVAALLAAPVVPMVAGASAASGAAPSPASSNATRARTLATTPCAFKPSAKNTGTHGSLRSSGVTVLHNHQTLKNARVKDLSIVGSHVTVDNVQVAGGILVTGDYVSIKSVNASSVAISSGHHVIVRRANIGNSSDDAMHVTSDRGSKVNSVILRYNYVHDPRPAAGAHFDGLQVRGVNNLVVRCNTYRAGTFRWEYNAGVFLEDANGGDTNVRVVRNWIYGFAFSVMVESPTSAFVANRVGGSPHWGTCHLPSGGGFYSAKNVHTPTGTHANLCGQG